MKMFKKMKKGFTLVELIIVMVILGALAAIAIPKMGGSTDGALLASVKSDLRVATVKANEYYSKQLSYKDYTGADVIASPGNTITVTPSTDYTSFTVSVERKAAPCKTSLSYNSSTGEYTVGTEKSTSIPTMTCSAS